MSVESPDFGKIDGSEAFGQAFEVSRETLDRLVAYEILLKKWQPAVNLVAPGTLDQVWSRHLADSAQVIDLIPEEALTLVDLGSGGGFPGLVLAILLAESRKTRCCLIESDQRKAAFLREVARQTGIAVDIVVSRIENIETQGKVGTADVVTARALAPLVRLFSLSHAYFRPETVGIFLKGRDVDRELVEARSGWHFDAELRQSRTGEGGKVVVVRNLRVITEG